MVMAIHAFPLIAYLTSAAYLVCWVIRLLQAIYQLVRSWALPRRMMFSLKTWGNVGEENGIYVYFIGILFGGLATLWLIHIFIQEWLLIIFMALAVLIEEMRISSTETLLLEVMIFFDRLAAHNENHQDLFETFPNVIQELPKGRVQKSVLEAVLRRRSGESFENSLKAMLRIDQLLDEFVLTLQHSGWKNGPGLNLILNRLMRRAGRRWDRASWRQLIKDKNRKYVQFSRGALDTGLWVILISSSSALNRVMPDQAAIVLAVLALLGFGFIFFRFLTRQWLRRSLVVSIFIIALVAYANSPIAPIPAWIQVETISHQSGSVRNTGMVTSQISTLNQGLTASFLPATLSKPPISGTSKPTSTPTPTAVATMILNPPVLISTPVVPQDFNLCCLRSRQPR
jgi:hypothetical protein